MTTRLSPVELAAERGHTVRDDPGGFGSVNRWTCITCGSAVLETSTVVYGSAIEQPCTSVKPCGAEVGVVEAGGLYGITLHTYRCTLPRHDHDNHDWRGILT